jgi:hypothetical protein
MKRGHFSSLFNAYGESREPIRTRVSESHPPETISHDFHSDHECIGCDDLHTNRVVFRDNFRKKLTKAGRGLPVSLTELETWFERDKDAIEAGVYSDGAIRQAVEGFVFYHLQRTAEPDLHPKVWGMYQCVDCYYWTGTWCRNSNITGFAGRVSNPLRWRRCRGYEQQISRLEDI